MTQINYDEVRTALTAAGYTMSEAGSQWTPADQHAYITYTKLHWPLHYSTLLMGQAYSEILPDGFPGKGTTPPEPGERTLLSIAISGPATVVAGQTITLVATGTYSAAPLTEDVTSTVTWSAGDAATATVAAGVVTGVAAGSTSIGATLGAVNAPGFTVTVEAAPVRAVQSVAITGPDSVAEGAAIQLTATATYNLAPLTEDVTATAVWTKNPGTSLGEGAEPGAYSGDNEGVDSVTATVDGIASAPHEVTVIGG